MQINERENADIKILDLSGSMYLNQGDPELQAKVNSAIEAGAKKLLLNMEGLEEMDSSALGSLVRIHARTRDAGAELALAAIRPMVYILFEATRMNRVFKIYDTEANAIAALS